MIRHFLTFVHFLPAPVLLVSTMLGPSTVSAQNREQPPVSWVNPKLPVGPGLSHHRFDSNALGHEVGYVVWTPDGYDENNEERYPVIYFLHGMGGDESMDAGGFSSLLRRAVKASWMPPVIAVFPNGGRSGYRDKVETMIIDELVPKIDNAYRTIKDARARGVAGFSMGGAGSVWLSLNHPDLFGFAGSWGGGLWRMEEAALVAAAANRAELKANGYKALLVNGDKDRPDAFDPLVGKFMALSIPHEVVVLEETPHNLGLYYQRAGERMTRFIGTQLRRPVAKSDDASPAGRVLHGYDRVMLTNIYYSEGVSAGDIDNDGVTDVVYGPFWFAGPDYKDKAIIYKTLPQPREGYANHFFSWTHDFDGDGWVDVFTVGFPGTPAHVYQNPGMDGHGDAWKKHAVFDWVSNESPHLTDLVGDGKPELVCTRDGFFGYATINWDAPFEKWTFHKISPKVAPTRFGHGLGVGDVNGDGRADVLMKSGWFEQPADLAGDPAWTFHEVPFAPRGGAEMYAYDVDGDGDSDVITSLAAHEFGLSWFEQTPDGFKEHLIMGDRPALNKYGVVFSELHSVNLADMDGDGLKDIVTGKTYWSHHRKSPGWDDGAVVYWFKLVRGEDGVDWIPFKADGESGIGRQVVVADINGDKLPDILAGGMKGAHVMIHRTRKVDEAAWKAAQPTPLEKTEVPPVEGKPAPIDKTTGTVPGALEGESLIATAKASGGSAVAQNMKNFKGARWSGDTQLFWKGGKVGDRLEFEISAAASGKHLLETVFTRAPDFGIVQLALDGRDIGDPLDLYHFSKVTTTGVLAHSLGPLEAGPHKLSIRITGANPNAVQSRFIGIDYLRLVPDDQ